MNHGIFHVIYWPSCEGAQKISQYHAFKSIAFYEAKPDDHEFESCVAVWHIKRKCRPIPIGWDGAVTASDNA